MEYHKEFSYFLLEYGLVNAGSLEDTPGVPPSAGRIAKVSLAAKSGGVFAALATGLAPKNVLRKFSESSGIPVVYLPLSIQTDKTFYDYENHQKFIAKKLVSLNRYAKK